MFNFVDNFPENTIQILNDENAKDNYMGTQIVAAWSSVFESRQKLLAKPATEFLETYFRSTARLQTDLAIKLVRKIFLCKNIIFLKIYIFYKTIYYRRYLFKFKIKNFYDS